jgi:hypothetical protein
LREYLIDDLLEPNGPLVDLAVGVGVVGAGAEELIRKVERDKNRQAEHIARRRRVGGGAHLLVDVRGQLGDVALLQIAADRIALAGDFDSDDAAQIASSCSSMSATRERIISRSSRRALISVDADSASASRARSAVIS